MREATLILPNDNATAIDNLRQSLLDAFDGYTEHDARGVWRDPATGTVYCDTNTVFTIGADTYPNPMPKLRDIARKAGAEADQITVYLKGFDGEVEFVDVLQEAMAA